MSGTGVEHCATCATALGGSHVTAWAKTIRHFRTASGAPDWGGPFDAWPERMCAFHLEAGAGVEPAVTVADDSEGGREPACADCAAMVSAGWFIDTGIPAGGVGANPHLSRSRPSLGDDQGGPFGWGGPFDAIPEAWGDRLVPPPTRTGPFGTAASGPRD